MISAIALSPSLDVTYVVDELDGIQRPRSVHRVAGGKALNAARAAAALGARVSAVAVLGAGVGRDVADGARADGVDVHVVPGTEPTRSCVSIFSRADGQLTEIYERAVPVSARTAAVTLDTAVGLAAARPGWWFVAGGLPDSAPDGLLADVVRRLHDAGVRVAVDSHGAALRSAVGARPDLVKVNRSEALELVGGDPEPSVPELLAAVHTRTGGLVVITDGAAGAWATDGDRVLRARLAGHTGNFPVGSGDSFLGGLLVALDGGAGLAEALALATATGTANAQVPGAALLDPSLARSLTQEVEILVVGVTDAPKTDT
ncbi:1-phosphofructokinase family hexose kinase [Promicromonospora panici]|uniref:1-phosphofructokinase family hexose kinase n=1 Tax=Promicromonospora panici TaxID=2219658 RepID=UPI00101D72EA|nr:PfkB family carbohydrate kinase [Promicromonospora panici]